MASQANVPPEGVQHYDSSADMPYQIQKYWHQRYDIFTRYDDGIWLTNDAWFGVTPEPVATKIAAHLSLTAPPNKKILVDAFAGAGGNTIAFARSGRWDQIFAVEKDPAVLECAKHNAAIYGVKNKIVWILGDCFDVLKKRLKTFSGKAVIFGSPPWGGPEYQAENIFSLSTMAPYSMDDLYKGFTAYSKDMVLFLPRTSDLNQLAVYTIKNSHDPEKKLEVRHYCMHGASKAVCVYFGDFEAIQ